jgi:hypothetical protein
VRRRPAIACASAALAVAAVLACGDGTRPNTCYDSNAFSYGFFVGGDTTLVFHWPANRMPVRFYAEPAGDLRANVLAGLTTWVNGFRCQEASFQLVGDSAGADVIVRQVVILPPVASRAIALAADSVGACGGRTDGTFDSTLTLTGPIRSYIVPIRLGDSVALAGCYRMVTTHELGHTLGVLSHSADPADLMYTTPRRSSLSPDDRYTLQSLYHRTPTIRPAPRAP